CRKKCEPAYPSRALCTGWPERKDHSSRQPPNHLCLSPWPLSDRDESQRVSTSAGIAGCRGESPEAPSWWLALARTRDCKSVVAPRRDRYGFRRSQSAPEEYPWPAPVIQSSYNPPIVVQARSRSSQPVPWPAGSLPHPHYCLPPPAAPPRPVGQLPPATGSRL